MVNRPKLIALLVAITVLVATLFVLPDSIAYARTGLAKWTPPLLILGVLPVLTYAAARSGGLRSDWSLGVASIAVLVVGPSYGLISERLESARLARDGATTPGVVVEHWERGGRRAGEWLFVAEFEIKERAYETFSTPDDDQALAIGDTVLVRYLPSNPLICEVIR